MRKWLCVVAMIGAASPACAALSGFYDSAEKIMTILGNGDVAAALRQAPVGAVTHTGTTEEGGDIWVVRTQGCDLTVVLTAEPLPEGMVGKTSYGLRIMTPCE